VKAMFFKKKRKEDNSSWLMTFSDLMTLLLVFFVLLYSFSVIDTLKFQRFMASFQGVGILERGDEPLDKSQDHEHDIDVDEVQQNLDSQDIQANIVLQETFDKIERYIQENELDIDVSIRYKDRSVVLEVKDEILFESGKAELRPEAFIVLNKLSGLLKTMPNSISVEGHTDNRPIYSSRFPSNWELSTARALAVVRHMSETLKLDPRRFAAVGYGEYRPVVANDSLENMARNRRVMIIINADDINMLEGADKSDT